MSLTLPASLQFNTIAQSLFNATKVFDCAEHHSYFGLKCSSFLISTIFATSGLSCSSCPSSCCPAALLLHIGQHFPEAFATTSKVRYTSESRGPIKTTTSQGLLTLRRTPLLCIRALTQQAFASQAHVLVFF